MIARAVRAKDAHFALSAQFHDMGFSYLKGEAAKFLQEKSIESIQRGASFTELEKYRIIAETCELQVLGA